MYQMAFKKQMLNKAVELVTLKIQREKAREGEGKKNGDRHLPHPVRLYTSITFQYHQDPFASVQRKQQREKHKE
jgi:hypothetical protein